MDIPILPILEHYAVEIRNPNRMEVLVLCPVHEEHVPSCSVNTEKNVLNCKSCGFAGDALSLIQRKEDCDFRAAIRFAEGIVGEIHRDLPVAARRRGPSVSGRKGAWSPRYRNSPPRRGARPEAG